MLLLWFLGLILLIPAATVIVYAICTVFCVIALILDELFGG